MLRSPSPRSPKSTVTATSPTWAPRRHDDRTLAGPQRQQEFLGVSVPEEFGGGGGGLTDLTLVLEELAAHGIPLFLGVISPAICGSILAAHGSTDQKTDMAPTHRIRGDDHGVRRRRSGRRMTNSHRVKTHARRDGDDWVIERFPRPSSQGPTRPNGSWWSAQTGNASAAGTFLFVVHVDGPGLHMEPIRMELVLARPTVALFFDDVRVPADAVIGEAGARPEAGVRRPRSGRVTVAALANGIGRYALDRAADYARSRRVWDVPIGAHQGISQPLAHYSSRWNSLDGDLPCCAVDRRSRVPVRPPTSPSTPPPKPRSELSTMPSRPTAGTG